MNEILKNHGHAPVRSQILQISWAAVAVGTSLCGKKKFSLARHICSGLNHSLTALLRLSYVDATRWCFRSGRHPHFWSVLPHPLLTLQHKLFLRCQICWWWYSLSFTPLSSPAAANNKEKQPNEQHPHKNSNNNDDLDPQHGNKQKNDSALQNPSTRFARTS